MNRTNWLSDDAWLGLFFIIMLYWWFPAGLMVFCVWKLEPIG